MAMFMNHMRESMASCEEIATAAGNALGVVTTRLWRNQEKERQQIDMAHKNAVMRDPIKRASKIRRWLTYMTLFITAGFIIGDLIALVNNLLGGGLTWRFVLKVLTVAIIAGAVFGYYTWDLRHEEMEAET